MTGKAFIIVLIVTVFVLSGRSGYAERPENEGPSHGKGSDWSVRLGVVGIYNPEYEGSDEYEIKGFPLIDITWRDVIFLNARKGLGAYVLRGPPIKLGFSVGYSFGRDEDDSSDLKGLGDVDGGATANVLFEGEVIDDLSFDARYEQQVTGDNTGFQVHLNLGYKLFRTHTFILKPSVATSYASSDYMEAYFGISQKQSVRSGLPAYDADAGFKSVGIRLMALYRLTRHWGIQALTGYDRLVGDAGDSPLVKDKHQYRIGAGISYSL